MRIWLGLLVAPMLTLADQSIAYATAGWACAHQNILALHGVHVVFLSAVVVATIGAWQRWRETRSHGRWTKRVAGRHFLAGMAVASGALSALVVLAMWIPNWMLSPCFG